MHCGELLAAGQASFEASRDLEALGTKAAQ